MKYYCEYKEAYLKPGKKRLYAWNMLIHQMKSSVSNVFVIDEKSVSLIEKVDENGYIYYETMDALDVSSIQLFQKKMNTHYLMSTSLIDSKWCYPMFKNVLSKEDQVCVLALSFFEDTKNNLDWDAQYSKERGIWYKENTNGFFRYGIKESQIQWVNPFIDSKINIENKILNSTVLLLPGGAPDQMMQRIKKLRLKKILKNYQGTIIGYSAGAMVQLNMYHITPDRDYTEFQYCTGLGYFDDFMIEVHYRGSNGQKRSIEKVLEEKNKTVYAIYEDGGLKIQENSIRMFGQVEEFR